MSVSDPLLKRLKGCVKGLRTDPKPIRDHHDLLQPFCETLELIFRKGLKQTTAIFGRNRKDYWHWVEQVSNGNSMERINPILSMVVQEVKDSKKVWNNQGKGRLFIRTALQKKTLSVPIESLIRNPRIMDMWYDPVMSIIGDEILREILMSVLFEATEINFKLNVKNASFLDDTWIMPVFRVYEFVPCKNLGINLQFIEDRAVVETVDPGSVAEEDDKVSAGDILDEHLGESLRGVRRGRLVNSIKQNQGFPVYLGIVKCKLPDESIFRPIGEILRKGGHNVSAFQKVLADDAKREYGKRVPPHAQLPEDEFDEVPVHNADGAASYKITYIGRIEIGQDGGVHMIESAIDTLLKRMEAANKMGEAKDVFFELGETNIDVVDRKTRERVLKHSYTEISSCGRRVDCVEHFAYIAGETTCTLAKNFYAFVFKANFDEESKTILCSIAQGFGRTHWFV